MALKEQIQNDMKAALLGGNRFEGDVLRNLKASILNEEVTQNKRETGLDDQAIEAIIAKEIKKRKESILLYEQNGRDDLAQSEKDEIEVLEKYLPEQMGESEILKVAEDVISELGATSPQQMGQVIGAIKAKVGTSADGALIAKVVKNLLAK